MRAGLRTVLLALCVSLALLPGVSVGRGGGHAHRSRTSHGSSSGPYYGGGHHTESHGGHYVGGHGSSHKGGHYMNPRTGDHYGHHK